MSAAYFLSIEFTETGGLVDSLYRASYGRRPAFSEFMPDRAQVAQGVRVGDADWSGILNANKQAFVAAVGAATGVCGGVWRSGQRRLRGHAAEPHGSELQSGRARGAGERAEQWCADACRRRSGR